MSKDKFFKNAEQIAKTIIGQQFEDDEPNGIDNYFLIVVMNELVKKQADKIKGYADTIFNHAKENNIDRFETKHLICQILSNTDEIKAFYIHDETIYSPNMPNIIVIDNVREGKFHIRRLSDPTLSVSKYIERDYQVPGDSHVTEGFVMTYNYMPELMRDLIKMMEDDGKSSAEINNSIESFNLLRTTESMGDNSFTLYDRVRYAASMIANICNHGLS